ncbi:MAG: Rieske 2Fe-2S domain-containing protein [Planctomycetales bacterium]|nr:Rieske 2Fe-2S domain-containing protein [Planctomycetales bacterium]
MTQRLRVAAASDVPVGEGREFVVGGRIVALFHVEDRFLALDGICPHAGGPLAQGKLNGCIVTCPWHGWQFDVATGQHGINPRLHHSSFTVTVEEGEVFVELPS